MMAIEAPTDGIAEHDGGDRSIYLEDPAGNIVEVWDFFARRPIEALAEEERSNPGAPAMHCSSVRNRR
jgi:catechol-2,3-dioxygenase